MAVKVHLSHGGNPVHFTAAADLASGDVVAFGTDFCGVVEGEVLTGAEGTAQTSGFAREVAVLSSDDVSAGNLLYWDAANDRLTLTSTSNVPFGRAVSASGVGTATVDVRLGIFAA